MTARPLKIAAEHADLRVDPAKRQRNGICG